MNNSDCHEKGLVLVFHSSNFRDGQGKRGSNIRYTVQYISQNIIHRGSQKKYMISSHSASTIYLQPSSITKNVGMKQSESGNEMPRSDVDHVQLMDQQTPDYNSSMEPHLCRFGIMIYSLIHLEVWGTVSAGCP